MGPNASPALPTGAPADPTGAMSALSASRPRTSAWSRFAGGVRRALGLPPTIVVSGVHYRERGRESLRRALSSRGSGVKEYDVEFPDGKRTRIRCTPDRLYADLSGPLLYPAYLACDPLIRPGMRLLDASCATGYGAAWLAERVGPSGAIVALDRDLESIRYARLRYPLGNVSFEPGGIESVMGEADGAFAGVFACGVPLRGQDAARVVSEWWRLIAPGGWLLVVAPLSTETPLGLGAIDARDLLARAIVGSPIGEESKETRTIPGLSTHAAWLVRKPPATGAIA